MSPHQRQHVGVKVIVANVVDECIEWHGGMATREFVRRQNDAVLRQPAGGPPVRIHDPFQIDLGGECRGHLGRVIGNSSRGGRRRATQATAGGEARALPVAILQSLTRPGGPSIPR